MSVGTDEIIDALAKILVDELDLGLRADRVTATVPLMEEGLGLDSIAIIELIAAVEQKFEFQLLDEDLRTSTFENLDALARVVHERKFA